MITLEQRQFEGKETYSDFGKEEKHNKDKRYGMGTGVNKSQKDKKDKPI